MSHDGKIRAAVDSTGLVGRLLSYSPRAYLVGGFIRDALLTGAPSPDIDLVIDEDIPEIVRIISDELGGSVVPLWDERITRIVMPYGLTIDIARMVGGCIEGDLRLRDFTVNAMAWRPECGLVDPCRGREDLAGGVLRMVSRANLRADPLRLLRAYRLRATKGFSIEGGTRTAIRDLTALIADPASERITLEMVKMLNAPQPLQALGEASEDGLLEVIICLENSLLQTNIQLVSRVEEYLYIAPEEMSGAVLPLGLSYVGLLRLEALSLGAGEMRMTLSRALRDRLYLIGVYYSAVSGMTDPLSREAFDLMGRCGSGFYDLLVLAGRPDILPHIERYLAYQGRPLVKTEEIMRLSGLEEGPGLGLMLKDLSFERYAGRANSRADVIAILDRFRLGQ
jgi:tRNA nucleotidyltransferase (CCA-adding enzyme)